ncbi:hypothetical protein D3C80_656660 [compost metagenome]
MRQWSVREPTAPTACDSDDRWGEQRRDPLPGKRRVRHPAYSAKSPGSRTEPRRDRTDPVRPYGAPDDPVTLRFPTRRFQCPRRSNRRHRPLQVTDRPPDKPACHPGNNPRHPSRPVDIGARLPGHSGWHECHQCQAPRRNPGRVHRHDQSLPRCSLTGHQAPGASKGPEPAPCNLLQPTGRRLRAWPG